MTVDAKHIAAVALAEKIGATATEALLEWGEAVNAAETETDPEIKQVETLRARVAGQEALRLAIGLAKTLRPRGKR